MGGCKPKNQKWGGAKIQGHYRLWSPDLQRTRHEEVLGWQFHKLHPLLPDTSLQPFFQGYLQEDVPQIQSENTVRTVFWGQSCVRWLGTFDTITGLNPWKKDKGIMGAVSTFAAAQTAITIGAGATYPFDTVRRRLQMQSEKPVEQHIYKGTMDCFKKI